MSWSDDLPCSPESWGQSPMAIMPLGCVESCPGLPRARLSCLPLSPSRVCTRVPAGGGGRVSVSGPDSVSLSLTHLCLSLSLCAHFLHCISRPASSGSSVSLPVALPFSGLSSRSLLAPGALSARLPDSLRRLCLSPCPPPPVSPHLPGSRASAALRILSFTRLFLGCPVPLNLGPACPGLPLSGGLPSWVPPAPVQGLRGVSSEDFWSLSVSVPVSVSLSCTLLLTDLNDTSQGGKSQEQKTCHREATCSPSPGSPGSGDLGGLQAGSSAPTPQAARPMAPQEKLWADGEQRKPRLAITLPISAM